jgi:hypothetical protein
VGFVPDLVFVTGDLANRGRADEHEEFWLDFMVKLQTTIGDGIEDRTFVVPGNHDVDRDENQGFSREELSQPSNHYFDPTGEGLSKRRIIAPRFRSFVESDLTGRSGDLAKELGAFANVLSIRDQKIGIAGINTAWLSKDDADERALTPGLPLAESVLLKLIDAELRIPRTPSRGLGRAQ